jgi:exodeoxyribonuclease-3
LPEEREMLGKITDWGTFDLYRHKYPESRDYFSWFDYRSKGFDDDPRRGLRIDLLLGTEPVLQRCTATGIDYEIRGMEKPSDHAPVWVELS